METKKGAQAAASHVIVIGGLIGVALLLAWANRQIGANVMADYTDPNYMKGNRVTPDERDSTNDTGGNIASVDYPTFTGGTYLRPEYLDGGISGGRYVQGGRYVNPGYGRPYNRSYPCPDPGPYGPYVRHHRNWLV